MSLFVKNKQQNHSLGQTHGQSSESGPAEHLPNGHRTPQSWHAPHDGMQVTEEEYWARYYEKGGVDSDVSYEWNNGVLEAKPMANQQQARLYNWFLEVLFHFLKVHPVALVMNLEIGFRMEIEAPELPKGKKVATRKPDVGVILNENPIPWLDEERSYHGTCDMVIESISDSHKSEIERDTVTKKREYQAAGIREYFILDPTEKHQHFYRLDANQRYVQILPIDGIICSEVLPGFQFRPADFAHQPSLEEMSQDSAYQDFVLPAYQKALRDLAEANLRISEERTRAERLAAKLRELGIDETELK